MQVQVRVIPESSKLWRQCTGGPWSWPRGARGPGPGREFFQSPAWDCTSEPITTPVPPDYPIRSASNQIQESQALSTGGSGFHRPSAPP